MIRSRIDLIYLSIIIRLIRQILIEEAVKWPIMLEAQRFERAYMVHLNGAGVKYREISVSLSYIDVLRSNLMLSI